MKLSTFIVLLGLLCFEVKAQYSGGPLMPEQAAYDVNYYEIDLNIHPDTQTIDGSVLCRARIVEPIDTLVLDLVNYYTVDSIWLKLNEGSFSMAQYTHTAGLIKVVIPGGTQVNDMITARVFYRQTGVIPVNNRALLWSETPEGNPWIGSSCEVMGSDWWWPCKEHPSDEPDSVSLTFTVPNPLMCISNGKFDGSADNGDGTSTYNWFVSTPINNYCITFYLAQYTWLTGEYSSISGDTIPFHLWVIPEFIEQAQNHLDVFKTEFDFLESICGPFPFGTDKHAVAHTPYSGMEHQTVIAYGSNFQVGPWGYDYLHYHELAHEWWGNLVTAKDWSDVWIHEGTATYTEALYVEHLSGMQSYFYFMQSIHPVYDEGSPLAPREELNAWEAIYQGADPYHRGAWVVHTLRYYLGDSVFMNLFKRWAYPTPGDYDNTHGRLCRIVTTDDMLELSEQIAGRELDNFFEVFFRETKFPLLKVNRENDTTWFRWETETQIPLDLDVPVTVNGSSYTIDMIDGAGYLAINAEDDLIIDPDKWILMEDPIVTGTNNLSLNHRHYELNATQNPFSGKTTINVSVPEDYEVTLKIYDNQGNRIATLLDEFVVAGNHEITFSAEDLIPGVYFCTMTAGKHKLTYKLMVL